MSRIVTGMHTVLLQALLLIVVANSAPVVARDIFRNRAAWPLDGGRNWIDGRPLFGRSKTLRGLLAAICAASLLALALGLPVATGAKIGALAMLGDLLASFVKRRVGLPSSSRATGLDQIPESLLPALSVAEPFGLSYLDVIMIVALFFVLEITFSPLLYRLGLRKRPY